METPVNALNLRIGGDKGLFRPDVIDRVTLMIRAVLEAASVHGTWLYMVTGPADSLKNPSQYSLEVREMSEVLTNMIHVAVRASLVPGGALIGMLKPPPEVRLSQLTAALQSYADIFNGSGWRSILVPEVRQDARFVGKPPVTTVLKPARRARETEDEDPKPLARVLQLDGPAYLERERARALQGRVLTRPSSKPAAPKRVVASPVQAELPRDVPLAWSAAGAEVSRPKFLTIGSPAPITKQEAAMPEPTTEHNDNLAEFLRQVLAQDGVTNGSFTGHGITRLSQPLFPQAAMVWQRMGILRELTGLQWIRRVGHGEYQVEQKFVTEHGLSISLTPRDRIARSDKKKQPTNGSKLNGHAHNGGGLQALLDQAALLNARIQEEAPREVRELEASLAEAQAAAVRAQELVAERQAALDALKARLAPLLTPLGATVTSVPVARS